MNPILAGVAVAVVAGAIVAVSVRDARIAVLALALTMILSPMIADPSPGPVGPAARLVGAILATYLLWMAVRDRASAGAIAGRPLAPTGGSRIGWPAEVLVAAAASIVGLAAHGLGATAGGPDMASVAGFAVAALAVTPVLTGSDVLRVGLGLFLLLDAALLVRVGLDGTPDPLEHLVIAGLTVVLGGSLAALAAAARSDGAGGLDLVGDPEPRRRRDPDAHPLDHASGHASDAPF
ncbi:hypothetical protein BH20CHL7_BH20CHL7_18610 [soil metagenome]